MALRQLAGALGRRGLQLEAAAQGWAQQGGQQLQQARTAVSVDVHNNQVDRALKTLKRKLIDEGLLKQWKANEVRRPAGRCAAAGAATPRVLAGQRAAGVKPVHYTHAGELVHTPPTRSP